MAEKEEDGGDGWGAGEGPREGAGGVQIAGRCTHVTITHLQPHPRGTHMHTYRTPLLTNLPSVRAYLSYWLRQWVCKALTTPRPAPAPFCCPNPHGPSDLPGLLPRTDPLLTGFGKTPALPYSDNNLRAELVKAIVEFAWPKPNSTVILISPSMSGYALQQLQLPSPSLLRKALTTRLGRIPIDPAIPAYLLASMSNVLVP